MRARVYSYHISSLFIDLRRSLCLPLIKRWALSTAVFTLRAAESGDGALRDVRAVFEAGVVARTSLGVEATTPKGEVWSMALAFEDRIAP
jgi:hypothetical protein